MVICALGEFLASNLRQWRRIGEGVHSPASNRIPARAPRRRGGLREARGRLPCLKLEGGDEVEEEACWGSSSPRKKRRSGWCSSPASSPGVLRRCRASMEREEEGELLHGLARERRCWGEWEGEIVSRGVLGRWRARADEWAREGYVTSRLYARDTHQGGSSGPSASEARTVRGWVT